MKISISFLIFLCISCALNAQYTWSEHIAPIVCDNCASCHHDDGIAPFNLMSYEDAVEVADEIHHVVDERSMPPWLADPDYRHFVGEAEFVVEIHYGPDGIGLTDSTIMNLQFITNPVDARPINAAHQVYFAWSGLLLMHAFLLRII